MTEATNNPGGEPSASDLRDQIISAQAQGEDNSQEPETGADAPRETVKQLILDKFKSTEELATAFTELEQKLTDTSNRTIEDEVLDGVLAKNPDMTRREAVKMINKLLSDELKEAKPEKQREERPVVTEDPKREKVIDYVFTEQLLKQYPTADKLIPTLRSLYEHDPRFRNETYLDILKHPDNSHLRELVEQGGKAEAMTVAGSEVSKPQQALPPVEEIKKMKSEDIKELIKSAA